jgi:hypothetical protein
MFAPRFSVSRSVLIMIGLVAGSLFPAGILLAQGRVDRDADALDQTQRRNEVAAQKVEFDVRAALREAERLTSSDPAKAAELLKRALAQVEEDVALSERRRETLKRLLRDRIRVTAATADDATRRTKKQADKQVPAADFRAEAEQPLTSQEEMRQLREGIKKWQKEANSPAAQTAADRANATANRLAENRQLQGERERRTNDALREVDKSALVPKSYFELPKDWKGRTRNRKGSNDVPLTAKEQAILRTMDSTRSVAFKNSRFEDVIEYLQTVTGLPIVVDKSALDEMGVTYDTPVTLQAKGVTVRSLLRKILGDLGLTYVIRDQTVQVVTAQQAREMLVVRVQYIGDLLFGGELARQIQAVQLISLITSTIDPQSWEVNGGSGKIFYDDWRRALVIKQSAELQPVLAGGLR